MQSPPRSSNAFLFPLLYPVYSCFFFPFLFCLFLCLEQVPLHTLYQSLYHMFSLHIRASYLPREISLAEFSVGAIFSYHLF